MATTKECRRLTVVGKEQPSAEHILLRLTDGAPLPPLLPGQFLFVRIANAPHTFLRRPFSIHAVDSVRNELSLLIHIVGEGTEALARLDEGDSVDSLLPLGRGYTLPAPGERLLLVGGGVGVAPLLFLGDVARQRGAVVTFLLGARTRAAVLAEEAYRAVGEVFIATDDGTYGERGLVTAHSILTTKTFDRIQTCGPMAMMRAVAQYAESRAIPCEVSLEHLMACGVGACLCCVTDTTKGPQRVCVDGPVFDSRDILWHD